MINRGRGFLYFYYLAVRIQQHQLVVLRWPLHASSSQLPAHDSFCHSFLVHSSWQQALLRWLAIYYVHAASPNCGVHSDRHSLGAHTSDDHEVSNPKFEFDRL